MRASNVQSADVHLEARTRQNLSSRSWVSFVMNGAVILTLYFASGLCLLHAQDRYDSDEVLEATNLPRAVLGLRCCPGTSSRLLWTSLPIQQYEGIAVAVDQQGNIYVAGRGRTAWLVASYDPQGNLRWQNTLTGSGGFVPPNALAVDNLGGVYVAGSVDGRPHMTKFDARTGNIVWSWNGASSGFSSGFLWDIALGNGLVTTSSGSHFVVYATGAIGSIKAPEALTVAFDSHTGALVSRHLYPEGSGEAIAVDASGKVWVAGRSGGRLAVLSYTSDLTLLGTYLHPRTSGTHSSRAYDIAVDQRGRVYVAGYEFLGGHKSITIAFTNAGFPTPAWTQSYDGTGAQVIAVDSVAGNPGRDRVVVIGNVWDDRAGHERAAAVAYDATAGTQLWVHHYPQRSAVWPGANTFPLRSLTIDHVGNVYVGAVAYSSTGQSHLVYKLCGGTGALLWQWTGSPFGAMTVVGAVVLDANGCVVSTGSEWSAGVPQMVVRKFRQFP